MPVIFNAVCPNCHSNNTASAESLDNPTVSVTCSVCHQMFMATVPQPPPPVPIPSPEPVFPPVPVTPPEASPCEVLKTTLKDRKNKALADFEEAKTAAYNLMSKVVTKRSQYGEGTACYKYYDFWKNKANDLYMPLCTLFTNYKNDISDPDWACTGTETQAVNTYTAKVVALESCVTQMRNIILGIQRPEWAIASPDQCPSGGSPEFRDPLPDVVRSRNFLMQAELTNSLAALYAGFITTTAFDTKITLLLQTRDTFQPGTACWNYYDDWYMSALSVQAAYIEPYKLWKAQIAPTTYDCMYDDMVFMYHEANMKIVVKLQVLLEAYQIAIAKVSAGTIPVSRNQCTEKPTP